MKIIECPRDAMQGIHAFIPTDVKVRYLNQLLKVGFDTLDFGSFVSPKAIPQMRDTADVLARLDLSATSTKLLAIVANTRGAEEAAHFDSVSYIGFPLSISETFQMRNTNKSISQALETLVAMKEVGLKRGKKIVTYISMGFGNPYGDPYEADLVIQFAEILITLGSDVISLADTIGIASPPAIMSLYKSLSNRFPGYEFGVHLHSNPSSAHEKIVAAFDSGCTRFDGALRGFGGCPMANDELVGNIATEKLINVLESRGVVVALNKEALANAMKISTEVFGVHP